MKRIKEWARSNALLILILITMATVILLPIMKPRVLIIAQEKDKTGYQLCLDPNIDCFVISFRHSVNKGLINEYYSVDYMNLTINLEKCEFESYGAGMPDQLPQGVLMTQSEDKIILSYPKDPQCQINILPGREANHRLYAHWKNNEQTVELGQAFAYIPVTIKIKRQSILDYLKSS